MSWKTTRMPIARSFTSLITAPDDTQHTKMSSQIRQSSVIKYLHLSLMKELLYVSTSTANCHLKRAYIYIYVYCFMRYVCIF